MKKQVLTLRERQLEYLRILKELDRFCLDNNLTYYMACGTLIGAVRHKGFIPWDDDLDVFMPRPDYKRMISEYKSSDFSFHTIYNDKSHAYVFGRLCSGNVCSLFRNKESYDFGIDVYVINGAPADKSEQEKYKEDTWRHIKRAEYLARARNGLARRGLWPFKSLDFNLLNKELILADHCFERYDYDTSDYIWPHGGGRLLMPKSNYGTPIRLEFEGGLYSAPEHYHDVLTLGYGDYMKLPPLEKRKPYHTGKEYYWKDK